MTTINAIFADKETRGEKITEFLNETIDRLIKKTEDAETLTWWKEILRLSGSFWKYSFRNLCLLHSQLKSPTFVAGAKSWQEKYGRTIRKGEKAAWILAPLVYKQKDKETGEEKTGIRGFRYVPVFDYAQTTPIDETSFRDPNEFIGATGNGDALLTILESFVASKGWKLEYVDGLPYRGCSAGKSIKIQAGLDSVNRARTLAHEIGHELLHWGPDGRLDADHGKTWRETEAESVAFAICSAYGIETSSDLYLNAWAATREIVSESTSRIFGAVKEVLAFAQEGS